MEKLQSTVRRQHHFSVIALCGLSFVSKVKSRLTNMMLKIFELNSFIFTMASIKRIQELVKIFIN